MCEREREREKVYSEKGRERERRIGKRMCEVVLKMNQRER